MKIHPIANLFPMMSNKELAQLTADIAANGLQEPVVRQGNALIDGRNRLKACEIAKVSPVYRELPEGVDPLQFILSANIYRRNLKTSQKAAIAAEMVTAMLGDNQHSQEGPQFCGPSPITAQQAAELMGVSKRGVEYALKRKREDPEAHEAAKMGKAMRKKTTAKTPTKQEGTHWVDLAIRTGIDGLGPYSSPRRNKVRAELAEILDKDIPTRIMPKQEQEFRTACYMYLQARGKAMPDEEPLDELSQKRFDKLTAAFQKDFIGRGRAEIKKIIDAREKELEEKYQRAMDYASERSRKTRAEETRAKHIREGLTAIMTKQQFNTILRAIHSDRYPEEYREKLDDAAGMLRRLVGPCLNQEPTIPPKPPGFGDVYGTGPGKRKKKDFN